jgi:serine/threonine-protein kinase RsbW
MPGRTEAISPLVDRLMLLIEGSQCVPGEEPDVELVLREALANAVLHGNQQRGQIKVHVRCRCGPQGELSVVVMDQGKGFDFRSVMDNAFDCGRGSERGHGLLLMKAHMDEVHFERGGSEVHMCKRARSRSH